MTFISSSSAMAGNQPGSAARIGANSGKAMADPSAMDADALGGEFAALMGTLIRKGGRKGETDTGSTAETGTQDMTAAFSAVTPTTVAALPAAAFPVSVTLPTQTGENVAAPSAETVGSAQPAPTAIGTTQKGSATLDPSQKASQLAAAFKAIVASPEQPQPEGDVTPAITSKGGETGEKFARQTVVVSPDSTAAEAQSSARSETTPVVAATKPDTGTRTMAAKKADGSVSATAQPAAMAAMNETAQPSARAAGNVHTVSVDQKHTGPAINLSAEGRNASATGTAAQASKATNESLPDDVLSPAAVAAQAITPALVRETISPDSAAKRTIEADTSNDGPSTQASIGTAGVKGMSADEGNASREGSGESGNRRENSAALASNAASANQPLRDVYQTLPPIVQSQITLPGADAAPAIATTSAAQALGNQVIDMGVSGQWIDRVAREITTLAQGTGNSQFALMPPHLGRIEISLTQSDAQTNVHFATETSEAAERIRAAQSSLQADARLSALALGTITVEKSAQSFDQTPRDGSAGNGAQRQADGGAQAGAQSQSQSGGQGGTTRENKDSRAGAVHHLSDTLQGSGRDNASARPGVRFA